MVIVTHSGMMKVHKNLQRLIVDCGISISINTSRTHPGIRKKSSRGISRDCVRALSLSACSNIAFFGGIKGIGGTHMNLVQGIKWKPLQFIVNFIKRRIVQNCCHFLGKVVYLNFITNKGLNLNKKLICLKRILEMYFHSVDIFTWSLHSKQH